METQGPAHPLGRASESREAAAHAEKPASPARWAWGQGWGWGLETEIAADQNHVLSLSVTSRHCLALFGIPFSHLDWEMKDSSSPCPASGGGHRRSEKGKSFEA